jgi:adenylate kinase family enzyme
MTLYVFSGIPGSGKSTLSRAIANSFGIDLISKDIEQVTLFEKFGFQSREEKLKLVKEADKIVEQNILQHIAVDSDAVLDKYVRDESFFQEIKQKYSVRIVYIYVYANAQTICDRYNKRGREERPLCMDVTDKYPFIKGESHVWSPMTVERVQEMLLNVKTPSCVDEYIEIDSSNLSIEEIINGIVKLLNIK